MLVGMIEIRGRRPAAAGMFSMGVVLAAIGGVMLTKHAALPGGFVLAIGIVTGLLALRSLLARAPQVCATGEGISFSGRVPIAWVKIKQIYVADVSVRLYSTKQAASAIAIDFHQRSTLFELPITFWLTTPFAVGDVDVSTSTSSETPIVLASRLEAMRVQVLPPTDDIAIASATKDLPVARVVDRS
jgi:hypothetical protein